MSYPIGFEKVSIPEGTSGLWSVIKFEVTEYQAKLENIRLAFHGQSRRIIPPGHYTRLVCGRSTVMSDTPAEAWEHRRLYLAAKGDILLNGLGLGFALSALLRKDGVRSITVIEKSQDVINLVGPSITDPRCTIIQADALVWRPEKGARFDVVWHDIWTDICGDNKKQMTALRRAYGRRTSWQSCWSEEYL
jgi:spermidine synthase